MQKQTWADYVATNSNGDSNSVIAGKIPVDPSTVGRWLKSSATPQPLQVIAFARAYGLSPIPGLIAAGHLTPEDVADGVVIQSTPTLDGIATHTLVDELERRLEAMSDYASWIRSIVHGSPSTVGLGPDVLRYLDPALPPAQVRGEDFIDVLGHHLEEAAEYDGQKLYQPVNDIERARRARNVGAPADTESEEAAGATDVRHEEDLDDYTP